MSVSTQPNGIALPSRIEISFSYAGSRTPLGGAWNAMRSKTSRVGTLNLVRGCLKASVVLSQTAHWHLSDPFVAEKSRLRLLGLKIYARFEVQLLAIFYWILHRPFIKNRWVRKSLYYGLAKFFAEMAIVSKVMTLAEIEKFIKEHFARMSGCPVSRWSRQHLQFP